MAGITAPVELHDIAGVFTDCCDLPRFSIFGSRVRKALDEEIIRKNGGAH